MAKQHHKSEPVTPQVQQRQYTVGYAPNGGMGDPAPAITLKGRWLEQAGFSRGTLVKVTIVGEHLLITALPRRSLMNDMLHKAEHLSEPARQELEQVIKGLMVRERVNLYAAK